MHRFEAMYLELGLLGLLGVGRVRDRTEGLCLGIVISQGTMEAMSTVYPAVYLAVYPAVYTDPNPNPWFNKSINISP